MPSEPTKHCHLGKTHLISGLTHANVGEVVGVSPFSVDYTEISTGEGASELIKASLEIKC